LSGQYRVRWFQDSDLETYIRGLNEALYEEYDEARFRWKMVNTPYSLGFVSIVVVEHDGVPVAFNSFLPLRVRIKQESFSIIQGCDGFVKPKHRRMGLFQKTLRFMFSELAGKGPEMLMGFNFAGSAGAAQKAGSTITGDVHALCAKASELAKVRVAGDDSVEVKPCSLEVLHHIYDIQAASTSKLHFQRTLEYLRWRYNHPIRRSSFYSLRDGEEEGYAAVSLEGINASHALILEDYTPILHKTHVASALIKEVLRTSGSINEVYLTETVGSSMNEAAQRLGFVPDHIYTLIMKNILGLEERGKKLYRSGVELTNLAEWQIVSSDVF
jgi:GNAT superfamily N-acetyltransferase